MSTLHQAIDEFAAENPQFRMALRPRGSPAGGEPGAAGGAAPNGPVVLEDPAFATFAAETAALEIVQGDSGAGLRKYRSKF